MSSVSSLRANMSRPNLERLLACEQSEDGACSLGMCGIRYPSLECLRRHELHMNDATSMCQAVLQSSVQPFLDFAIIQGQVTLCKAVREKPLPFWGRGCGDGHLRPDSASAIFLEARPPGHQDGPISACRPMLASRIMTSVTSRRDLPTMELKLLRCKLCSFGLQQKVVRGLPLLLTLLALHLADIGREVCG